MSCSEVSELVDHYFQFEKLLAMLPDEGVASIEIDPATFYLLEEEKYRGLGVIKDELGPSVSLLSLKMTKPIRQVFLIPSWRAWERERRQNIPKLAIEIAEHISELAKEGFSEICIVTENRLQQFWLCRDASKVKEENFSESKFSGCDIFKDGLQQGARGPIHFLSTQPADYAAVRLTAVEVGNSGYCNILDHRSGFPGLFFEDCGN